MISLQKYMLQKYMLLCAAMLCGLVAGARTWTVDEVPNVQLADSTQLVVNPDGVLSAQAVGDINSLLLDIRRKSTAEVVVAVLDDIDGGDIDEFGVEMFDSWGIGKKDRHNGVLVLVVPGQRKYTIKTGYGVEGILPTVTLARLTRRRLEPELKKGDYDTGLLNVATELNRLMTTPEAVAELHSDQKGLGHQEYDEGNLLVNLVKLYLLLSFVVALVASVALAVKLRGMRGRTPYDKYIVMRQSLPMLRVLSWMFLALALPAYLILRGKMRRWRDGEHKCPNCGTAMVKQDEDRDNDYLTPAQDTEERLNSVDYDVWLCPNCGEQDVYSFVNRDTPYTVCPVCNSRAMRHVCDRIIVRPSATHEGRGEHEFICENCRHRTLRPYNIAKTAPPVVIIPGGGGGGGFSGGGGFGGGGFGGGMTSGGGVSGGW